MRTTVTIQDHLLRQARKAAIERSCTLSDIVEEALQKALNSASAKASEAPTRLPTFRGRGLRSGVDLDDTSGLVDVMDGR